MKKYWSVLKPKDLNSEIEGSIEMIQRANILIQVYALKNISDENLLSTYAGMRAYSCIKMGIHPRCSLVKFVKFCSYRTQFLKKTPGWLLLISSNIFNVSPVLSAINKLIKHIFLLVRFLAPSSISVPRNI